MSDCYYISTPRLHKVELVKCLSATEQSLSRLCSTQTSYYKYITLCKQDTFKTYTGQIPNAEIIYDTGNHPVSQWGNYRSVSADRILPSFWGGMKQHYCQPHFGWAANNRESQWKAGLLWCCSIVGVKGDELDCSVDGSISPGTTLWHAGDKVNTPIQSCRQKTIQSLLLSNQIPAP